MDQTVLWHELYLLHLIDTKPNKLQVCIFSALVLFTSTKCLPRRANPSPGLFNTCQSFSIVQLMTSFLYEYLIFFISRALNYKDDTGVGINDKRVPCLHPYKISHWVLCPTMISSKTLKPQCWILQHNIIFIQKDWWRYIGDTTS